DHSTDWSATERGGLSKYLKSEAQWEELRQKWEIEPAGVPDLFTAAARVSAPAPAATGQGVGTLLPPRKNISRSSWVER
ncbi:MAG: hypothetical protein WCO00_09350, partial [Rhodospirillaceae bacterium]